MLAMNMMKQTTLRPAVLGLSALYILNIFAVHVVFIRVCHKCLQACVEIKWSPYWKTQSGDVWCPTETSWTALFQGLFYCCPPLRYTSFIFGSDGHEKNTRATCLIKKQNTRMAKQDVSMQT